eukprot:m.18895 g.18895  ORF g.18895 m.18895 type:complete len:515 (-) comp3705_c0_seq1:178-1722(-)
MQRGPGGDGPRRAFLSSLRVTMVPVALALAAITFASLPSPSLGAALEPRSPQTQSGGRESDDMHGARASHLTTIVVGLGCGRSGSLSMSKMLTWHHTTLVLHGGSSGCQLMPWPDDNTDHEMLRHRARLWLHSIEERALRLPHLTHIGVFGFFLLPYAKILLELDSRVKVIVLQRDRDENIQSFTTLFGKRKYFPWMSAEDKALSQRFRELKGWEECYPNLAWRISSTSPTIEEGAARWIDLYYTEVNRLAALYPLRIISFRSYDVLSNELTAHRAFEFLQMPRPWVFSMQLGDPISAELAERNKLKADKCAKGLQAACASGPFTVDGPGQCAWTCDIQASEAHTPGTCHLDDPERAGCCNVCLRDCLLCGERHPLQLARSLVARSNSPVRPGNVNFLITGDESLVWTSQPERKHFISLDFGTPTVVTGYSFRVRSDARYKDESPEFYSLEATHGSMLWRELDFQSKSSWAAGEVVTHWISPEFQDAYRYYRLVLDQEKGYRQVSIAGIFLYGS